MHVLPTGADIPAAMHILQLIHTSLPTIFVIVGLRYSTEQMSDQPLLSAQVQALGPGGSGQQTMSQRTMPQQTVPLADSKTDVQYVDNLSAQSGIQQQRSPLQPVGDQAVGHSESKGFDAGKDGDHSGLRGARPNTPEATEIGPRVPSKDQQGTAHLTGNLDDGMKGSWLTQLIGKAALMKQTLCNL